MAIFDSYVSLPEGTVIIINQSRIPLSAHVHPIHSKLHPPIDERKYGGGKNEGCILCQ